MYPDDRECGDDGETVWCAHCLWCAMRTWPHSVPDAGWAMRVLAEHIRESHPERLASLAPQPLARAG